jgi:peptidoglycan hydrolase-like protein with peptidoglycan-binding domain
LSWTASTDNVEVAGYYIYRDGEWVGSSATASYTDDGLTQATSYQYTVYAYDEVGNMSVASGPVSVTTGDVAPPSAPSNLAVFAGITQLRLSWTASTDGAATVVGYDIYCDGKEVGASATASYLAIQLNPGTTYDYTIEAYDSLGNTSVASTGLEASTLNPSRGPGKSYGWPPTLAPNESSFGVAIVQYGLRWLGFYAATGVVTGHYGPGTDAAVRAFQKRYNCEPPRGQAQFGPRSWDALTSARGSATSLPTLVWNESSFGVVIVQYSLQRLGFYPRSSPVNGQYSSVTDGAIRAFQASYHSVPAYNASRFGNASGTH